MDTHRLCSVKNSIANATSKLKRPKTLFKDKKLNVCNAPIAATFSKNSTLKT